MPDARTMAKQTMITIPQMMRDRALVFRCLIYFLRQIEEGLAGGGYGLCEIGEVHLL